VVFMDNGNIKQSLEVGERDKKKCVICLIMGELTRIAGILIVLFGAYLFLGLFGVIGISYDIYTAIPFVTSSNDLFYFALAVSLLGAEMYYDFSHMQKIMR